MLSHSQTLKCTVQDTVEEDITASSHLVDEVHSQPPNRAWNDVRCCRNRAGFSRCCSSGRERSPLPQKNAINARRREDFAEHHLRRQRLAEPSDTRIPCLFPHVASHMRAAVFS
jgi:hypothetical protein